MFDSCACQCKIDRSAFLSYMKCIFSSQKLFPYIRKTTFIDLIHPLNLHEKYQFGLTDYISRALK